MESEASVSEKSNSLPTDCPGQLHAARWPVLAIACSVIVLVSFRHTLFLMVNTWSSSRTYSHCFLILPLFIYLVWVRRESITGLRPVPNYWGVPLLGGLAFLWLLGNLGEVRLVQELAMVSILIGVLWTLLGTAVARALAFPLLFLFFAVPFGTSLIRPLQDFTAWFVIRALTFSNVPAVLDNHTISLPKAVWEVAEACSGIRFLLSAVVMGTVFSFLMYRSRWRRVIFICASILTPIIGNGFRAYGIILLAYLSNNKLAQGVDHLIYGGIFSVFIQLVLIAIGLRWREKPEPSGRIALNNTDIANLTANHPRNNPRPDYDVSPGQPAFFVAAGASALIVLTPLVAGYLWSRSMVKTEWADPPVSVTAPWQVTAPGVAKWAPEWHNPDRVFSESYENDSDRVDLDWVLYSGRHALDLLATSVADTNSWAHATDDLDNAIVAGQPIEVHRSLIRSGTVLRSVWTWYCVSGEYTASRAQVRLLQARARLLGKPAGVAVITLGVENPRNDLEAKRVLQEFLLHASFCPSPGWG